jgi:hypothetical protein
MPYKTLKQDCKRSDGKQGRYILKVKPKPGKYKGRKRDSKGFVRIGCHPSKDAASKQLAAIEAPPREGANMKITAKQLRQIIREEIERIQTPEQLSEQASSEQELFDKYWSEGNPLITKFIGKKGATHGPDARAKDVSGARRAVAKRRLAALTTAHMEKIARLIRDQEGEQRRKAITKIFKSL